MFWRRVFDEIQRTPLKYKNACKTKLRLGGSWKMDDRFGFFDGLRFPRFCLFLSLQGGRQRAIGMALEFGGVPYEASTAREEGLELLKVMNRLEPFVQRDRLYDIELELVTEPDVKVAGEAEVNKLIRALEGMGADAEGSLRQKLLSPRFIVAVVGYSSSPSYPGGSSHSVHSVSHGSNLIRPINFGWQEDRFLEHQDRVKLMKFVRWSLRLQRDAYNGGIRRMSVSPHHHWTRCIVALFSALPHTTCLDTIQVRPFDGSVDLSAFQFAMVNYAIYHPDTINSTWRTLLLPDVYNYEGGSLSSAAVLDLMSQGNNLLVAAGLSTERAHMYYTATLHKQSRILTRPHDDAALIDMLKDQCTMDVCVSTVDISSLDEWVAVVVPGYGLGWLRRGSITNIIARRPGRPCLTGFQPSLSSSYQALNDSLIRVLGPSLKSMRVHEKYLPVVRESCAQLESLQVYIDSGESTACELPPTLRHLHLSCAWRWNSKNYLVPSLVALRNLETLYVESDTPPRQEDIDTLILPVLRALPQLRRLFWSDSRSVEFELRDMDVSYAQKGFTSREVINGLRRGEDVVATLNEISRPLLEVLTSVVVYYSTRSQRRNPIACLNRESIMRILEFTGTTVPRDIMVWSRHVRGLWKAQHV